MLNGELLGGGVLTGQIGREVITISKEEQDVVIEPRREQFDVYPDVGKVIKKATVKAVTSDIDENIVARNIRSGVTILGVTGDLEPDKPDQSKVVEPSKSEQVVTADSGYELASVTGKAIPEEYVVPSGDLDITENGTYKVAWYENANVNVEDDRARKIIDRTITEYDDSAGNVKYVGSYVFAYCSNLSYVNLPSCSLISGSAFYYNRQLNYINVPMCQKVSYSAFYNCINLESISLPNCSYIEAGAFQTCYSLKSISIPNAISVSASVFSLCSSLSNIDMPKTQILGEYAFYSCRNLENASIPLASNILTRTFERCSSLSKLICENVTYIYPYVFSGCNNLSELYLYTNSVIKLNNSNAFTSTPMVYSSYLGYYGSIYVPNDLLDSYKSATNWAYFAERFVGIPNENFSKLYAYQFYKSTISEIPSQFLSASYVGYSALYSCSNLNSVDLPNCKTVLYNGFRECSSLKTVNIPNCEYISPAAFYYCSNLTTISCPKVEHCSQYAFYRCEKLQSIQLNNCLKFSYSCFCSCLSLSYIEASNVKIISNGAFSGCQQLLSVNFPLCSSILNEVFYYCYRLSQVFLPNCEYVGNSAFYNCTNLLEISLPKCSSILSNTFRYCYSLSKAYLPVCNNISSYAFYGCSNLLSLILLSNSVCNLSTDVFYSTPIAGYTKYTDGIYGSVYVPESLVEAYKVAPNWSSISDRITAYVEP